MFSLSRAPESDGAWNVLGFAELTVSEPQNWLGS